MRVPGCFIFRSLTYLSLQICGSRFLNLLLSVCCLMGFLSMWGTVCVHALPCACLHVCVLS